MQIITTLNDDDVIAFVRNVCTDMLKSKSLPKTHTENHTMLAIYVLANTLWPTHVPCVNTSDPVAMTILKAGLQETPWAVPTHYPFRLATVNDQQAAAYRQQLLFVWSAPCSACTTFVPWLFNQDLDTLRAPLDSDSTILYFRKKFDIWYKVTPEQNRVIPTPA